MIVLRDVAHTVKGYEGNRWLLKDQSLVIGDQEKVGIFAGPSAFPYR